MKLQSGEIYVTVNNDSFQVVEMISGWFSCPGLPKMRWNREGKFLENPYPGVEHPNDFQVQKAPAEPEPVESPSEAIPERTNVTDLQKAREERQPLIWEYTLNMYRSDWHLQAALDTTPAYMLSISKDLRALANWMENDAIRKLNEAGVPGYEDGRRVLDLQVYADSSTHNLCDEELRCELGVEWLHRRFKDTTDFILEDPGEPFKTKPGT